MYGLPPTTAAYSITGHAELFPGRIVCKSYTRSSDKLQAKVNGVLMDTNITSALLKTPSEIITRVIIGEKREPVSWRGDSGGLFLDATGNLVVGMIIGGGVLVHSIPSVSRQTWHPVITFCPSGNTLQQVMSPVRMEHRFDSLRERWDKKKGIKWLLTMI